MPAPAAAAADMPTYHQTQDGILYSIVTCVGICGGQTAYAGIIIGWDLELVITITIGVGVLGWTVV